MASALSYAHGDSTKSTKLPSRNGIVHRDISPSNILLSRSGEVKLTDFGIAKELRSEESMLTTGFKGKLVYMSPEQLHGRKLDRRSDLFSLGVLLYECLAGVRPFDADSDFGTVKAIVNGIRKPLQDVCESQLPPSLINAECLLFRL